MTIHWAAAFAFLIPLPWIGFAFLITKGGVRMRDGSIFSRETKPGAYKAYLVSCALMTALCAFVGIGGLLGLVPVH
jgi:hypothetical protein